MQSTKMKTVRRICNRSKQVCYKQTARGLSLPTSCATCAGYKEEQIKGR